MAHGRPDFSPTAVDVVLRPEWAAKEGTDKTLVLTGGLAGYGTDINLSYAVPAGKTLYITEAGFLFNAQAAADGELNQMGHMLGGDLTTGIYPIIVGGNGGGSIALAKPITIPGGHTFYMLVASRANHACYGAVVMAGYEV